MNVDKARFLALIAMSAAPAAGCFIEPAPVAQPVQPEVGNQADPRATPASSNGADDEGCTSRDPTGECHAWAQPTNECIDWDPSGECVNWMPSDECWDGRDEYGNCNDYDPVNECVNWDPSGECIDWQ